MWGVENSENCCSILNCDIYHLFWVEELHDHDLFLWQLDDLLEIVYVV